MKKHCSLTIRPHLVSLFLVGEKPVSFYAAFISICISDISLVVRGWEGKTFFFFWLSSRKEKRKEKNLSELLFHSLLGFFFFLKTSMFMEC